MFNNFLPGFQPIRTDQTPSSQPPPLPTPGTMIIDPASFHPIVGQNLHPVIPRPRVRASDSHHYAPSPGLASGGSRYSPYARPNHRQYQTSTTNELPSNRTMLAPQANHLTNPRTTTFLTPGPWNSPNQPPDYMQQIGVDIGDSTLGRTEHPGEHQEANSGNRAPGVGDTPVPGVDLSELNLAGRIFFGEIMDRGGYSDISQGILFTDSTTRQVAIKALRIRGSSTAPGAEERLLKHFCREILLWRNLKHSNVVPLLGYLMLPNEPPTLISPWYINGNAIIYLKLNPKADRQGLARDVANGLNYLHSIPVVHGDLKGENVLVNDDGRASLCDFGMSQFIDSANRITGGTDRFMSPELLEDEPKSPATDIWALGCLIVQILTDEIPYQHIEKKSAVYAAILRGKLPFLERNDAIDIAVWECVKVCWSTTPSERPAASKVAWYLLPPREIRAHIIQNLAFSKVSKKLGSSNASFRFSPDGNYLAIANNHLAVDIWSFLTDIPILLKTLNPGPFFKSKLALPHIYCTMWNLSQSHMLVYMGSTTDLRVIEVETNECISYGQLYHGAKFSFGGNSIGLVHGSHTIIIKDLTQLQTTLHTIDLNTRFVKDFAFLPGDQRLLILTTNKLQVYNLITAEFETSAPISKLTSISVSKDGVFVLTGASEYPELWKLVLSGPNTTTIQPVPLHYFQLPSTMVPPTTDCRQFGGPQDELVLANASHAYILIWDRDTASLIHSIPGHGGSSPLEASFFHFSWNSLDPKDLMLAITTVRGDPCFTLEIWTVSLPGRLAVSASDENRGDN